MNPTPPTSTRSDAAAISREEIEMALQPARDRFLGLLADRILALEALRKQAASEDHPDAALANIAGIVHKISGVAATLGFPRAGALASIVDKSLSDMRKKAANYRDIQCEIDTQLEALLTELEVLLDQ